MKYIFQFMIIALFTFLGELLNHFIPLPIPAAVYGLVLLFLALWSGIVKLEQVEEMGNIMIGVMAILFVSPAVNLMDCWSLIQPHLIALFIMLVVTTILTFGVAAKITEFILKKEEKKKK